MNYVITLQSLSTLKLCLVPRIYVLYFTSKTCGRGTRRGTKIIYKTTIHYSCLYIRPFCSPKINLCTLFTQSDNGFSI